MSFNTIFGKIFFTAAAAVLLSGASRAADFKGTVANEKGKPVQDAVVYLVPVSGKAPAVKKGAMAVMDQKNKQYVPYVLPVQVGTLVNFPNSDNIFHHVYSFSAAKRFELPLYKGKPSAPVLFDKSGAVLLGCNIHDWMRGYVVVLDTPWFAKTGADGAASIKDVPPGDYTAKTWHPDMKGNSDGTARKVTVDKDRGGSSAFSIKLNKKKSRSGGSEPSGGFQY